MIELDDALLGRVGQHLVGQRWYAGGPAAPAVALVRHQVLQEGPPGLHWLLVEAGGATYQLLLGVRPEDDDLDFLHGPEPSVVGVVTAEDEPVVVYDALLDQELARQLLRHVSAGGEEVSHVRPIGAEQSNSSLVYDDRLILKVFRRLHQGRNPDAEVTVALGSAGFDAVAAPVAVWQHEGWDLAIVQPFLAGASEGWALALTSLRDFYGSDGEDPAASGGDFGGEARRLGEVTARLHLALAEAFGRHPADVETWTATMRSQLDSVAGSEPWRDEAGAVLDQLAIMSQPGAAIRAHGDYHLGQVMRTDLGWYVLDFEGEPARPLTERQLPTSPLKDVAGMVRSFHYAAHVVLAERTEEERKELEGRADAWEERNRLSFLLGYFSTPGIEALVPPEEDRARALRAWELDKAIYELAYERAHRPEWQSIPRSAIERLVNG